MKNFLKLKSKKYRYDFRQYFVEGVKGVEEALAFADVAGIFYAESSAQDQEIKDILKAAREKDLTYTSLSRERIAKLKGTATFPGVMAIVNMPKDKGIDYSKPIICLDHISDPGNLGTIIRTADWFGFEQILLSEGSVDPYNEKVVRATMGSLFRMNIVQSATFSADLERLQDNNYDLIGLDMNGTPITNADPIADNTALIFGSESHGMEGSTRRALSKTISIPGKGDAESLNLAVAAAITMHQLSR